VIGVVICWQIRHRHVGIVCTGVGLHEGCRFFWKTAELPAGMVHHCRAALICTGFLVFFVMLCKGTGSVPLDGWSRRTTAANPAGVGAAPTSCGVANVPDSTSIGGGAIVAMAAVPARSTEFSPRREGAVPLTAPNDPRSVCDPRF